MQREMSNQSKNFYGTKGLTSRNPTDPYLTRNCHQKKDDASIAELFGISQMFREVDSLLSSLVQSNTGIDTKDYRQNNSYTDKRLSEHNSNGFNKSSQNYQHCKREREIYEKCQKEFDYAERPCLAYLEALAYCHKYSSSK